MRQEANGSYSFRSVRFPHCYIRLDGSGVFFWLERGGGTVNCQYYDDPSAPASTWESFLCGRTFVTYWIRPSQI